MNFGHNFRVDFPLSSVVELTTMMIMEEDNGKLMWTFCLSQTIGKKKLFQKKLSALLSLSPFLCSLQIVKIKTQAHSLLFYN